MVLTQASVFCQLKETMPNLFLRNLYTAAQEYNIFDSMGPILERHSHLTHIQKDTLLIVLMDKVNQESIFQEFFFCQFSEWFTQYCGVDKKALL